MKKVCIAAILSAVLFSCKKISQQDKDLESTLITSNATLARTAAPTSIKVWQQCLGTTADDLGQAVAKTTDGYFVAGYTTINGNRDAIVTKTDLNGNLIWQKIIGGLGLDEAAGVASTPDGGCLVAGYTQSNDGYITGKGSGDILLFKLLPNGDRDWVTTLGGSGYDRAFALIKTSDVDGYGYALAGNTTSTDGDVTNSQVVNGNAKMWLVKFNIISSPPLIDFQKTIGSPTTKNEVGYSLVQGVDGGFTIAGNTYTVDAPDIWIVNTYSSGDVRWTKTIATAYADVAFGVANSFDNSGYVVTGNLSNDLIAVKLNLDGTISWQKIFAAGTVSKGISGRSVVSTSQGDIIVGRTNSKNGDIIATKGGEDMVVLRLDDVTGNKISSNVLGGSADDGGKCVIPAYDGINFDGTYIATGGTTSNNGDVSGNHGLTDLWLVKFKF